MGLFTDKLKTDNYDVFGLTFQQEFAPAKGANPNPDLVHAKAEEGGKKKVIPNDCKTLIVAGVSKTLSSETLEAIERYMKRGGKMLVFLDVIANDTFTKLKDTGLEPMLKRYSVEVTDSIPLSIFTRNPRIPPIQDIRQVEADTPLNSSNPLPKQFADKVFLLPRSARILKLAETPGQFKAESIMEMYPAGSDKAGGRPGLIFNDVPVLADPFNARGRSDAETSVNCSSTSLRSRRPWSPPRSATARSRAWSSSATRSSSPTANWRRNRTWRTTTMVANCLEWLAERGDWAGGQPRETFQISRSTFGAREGEDDLWRMILMPGWLMLLTLIGLGVGIWITRRR